jgi:hypothetical protein
VTVDILAHVHRPRLLIAVCLTLGLLALALPAASLAGGSAGDQQYTDPFGGGAAKPAQTTTASTPASTSTPVAPPATTTAAAPPATTPAAPAQTTPVAPAAANPTAPDPTATTATSSDPPATLPMTGYSAWMAGGFGAVMLASGLALRRRALPPR